MISGFLEREREMGVCFSKPRYCLRLVVPMVDKRIVFFFVCVCAVSVCGALTMTTT